MINHNRKEYLKKNDMYTLVHFKRINNKSLLYSTGISAQCYVAAGWERSLGENGNIYMYVQINFSWAITG